MHCLENRYASFSTWPHRNKENFLAKAKTMAAAGYFYNSENDTDDVATCYMCRKSLDFWEEQDNPWIQHCSHSPECPLVNLDKFENRVATFIAWPHKDFDADCNAVIVLNILVCESWILLLSFKGR